MLYVRAEDDSYIYLYSKSRISFILFSPIAQFLTPYIFPFREKRKQTNPTSCLILLVQNVCGVPVPEITSF